MGHDKATDYLATVRPRLEATGFRVKESITYGNQAFTLVGKRTRFQAEFFGFMMFFFIFAEFAHVDEPTFRSYSEKCFNYATRLWGVPLPRGIMHSVACFPVALAHSTDAAAVSAIRTVEPRRHWAGCEMPVTCDLSTGQIHFFEGTPTWGSLYWDGFRDMARDILSPEASE